MCVNLMCYIQDINSIKSMLLLDMQQMKLILNGTVVYWNRTFLYGIISWRMECYRLDGNLQVWYFLIYFVII